MRWIRNLPEYSVPTKFRFVRNFRQISSEISFRFRFVSMDKFRTLAKFLKQVKNFIFLVITYLLQNEVLNLSWNLTYQDKSVVRKFKPHFVTYKKSKQDFTSRISAIIGFCNKFRFRTKFRPKFLTCRSEISFRTKLENPISLAH